MDPGGPAPEPDPQQLVTQSVEERLSGRKKYVSQAIKRIIKKNEELYLRLA